MAMIFHKSEKGREYEAGLDNPADFLWFGTQEDRRIVARLQLCLRRRDDLTFKERMLIEKTVSWWTQRKELFYDDILALVALARSKRIPVKPFSPRGYTSLRVIDPLQDGLRMWRWEFENDHKRPKRKLKHVQEAEDGLRKRIIEEVRESFQASLRAEVARLRNEIAELRESGGKTNALLRSSH